MRSTLTHSLAFRLTHDLFPPEFSEGKGVEVGSGLGKLVQSFPIITEGRSHFVQFPQIIT